MGGNWCDSSVSELLGSTLTLWCRLRSVYWTKWLGFLSSWLKFFALGCSFWKACWQASLGWDWKIPLELWLQLHYCDRSPNFVFVCFSTVPSYCYFWRAWLRWLEESFSLYLKTRVSICVSVCWSCSEICNCWTSVQLVRSAYGQFGFSTHR